MRIGTIKGIKIKLHFSTLFIVGLVGFYSAILYIDLARQANHEVILLELVLVFLLNGILILLSILIHELSHSLMALRYGLKVSEIELYLFGGVSKMEEEPKTPSTEAPTPTAPARKSCPYCNTPLTWIPQYRRYYCYSCQQYI